MSCLQLYLQTLGVETRYVPNRESPGLRRELMGRLGRVLRGFPKKPAPHGRFNRHLWDLFPESANSTEDEFLRILSRSTNWIIVPESPKEPTLKLESWGPGTELPRSDLYLFSEGVQGVVLGVDHEGYGPWKLGPEPMGRIVERPTKLLSPQTIPGEPIEPRQAQLIRSWLKKRLGKRFYVPSYPLAYQGPMRDHLWNYIPEVFDADLYSDSLALELIQGAEEVLVWTDAKSVAHVMRGSEAVSLVRVLRDAYYLEWPRRRWLLAVPGEKVLAWDDSFAEASFVANLS